eukprot:158793-Chlamydomonas_euryale.AAC.7
MPARRGDSGERTRARRPPRIQSWQAIVPDAGLMLPGGRGGEGRGHLRACSTWQTAATEGTGSTWRLYLLSSALPSHTCCCRSSDLEVQELRGEHRDAQSILRSYMVLMGQHGLACGGLSSICTYVITRPAPSLHSHSCLQDAIAEAAILASTMTSKHDVYNTGEEWHARAQGMSMYLTPMACFPTHTSQICMLHASKQHVHRQYGPAATCSDLQQPAATCSDPQQPGRTR